MEWRLIHDDTGEHAEKQSTMLDIFKECLKYLTTDVNDVWRSTHMTVCAYMDNHKQRPYKTDENPEVKKLGAWITSQKKNYEKNRHIMALNPEIRAEWAATLEHYSAYLITDLDEQWYATHRTVCAYMNRHKQRPYKTDKNPAVRKLGKWIRNQKKNYTNNVGLMASNPAIRAEWAATLEKYRAYLITDFEEQWRTTHQEVCDYMDRTGKVPSAKDGNSAIGKLGRWINHQKSNYEKNVRLMASHFTIRAEWAATMVKYAELI
jgi:hypothetical protein